MGAGVKSPQAGRPAADAAATDANAGAAPVAAPPTRRHKPANPGRSASASPRPADRILPPVAHDAAPDAPPSQAEIPTGPAHPAPANPAPASPAHASPAPISPAPTGPAPTTWGPPDRILIEISPSVSGGFIG